MRPLRVCIDARLPSGQCGGTEQVIIGLAAGLSQLGDGEERYLFLTYADESEWLLPYVHGPCSILQGERVGRRQHLRRWLASNLPGLRDVWHSVNQSFEARSAVARSDGTIERACVDVMHFTTQNGFLTSVPSIYQPHDLQHLHLPQFFSRRECLLRETRYRAFCEQAEMIAIMTFWGKRDLILQYKIPDEKVVIVPWAPVLSAYPKVEPKSMMSVRKKFRLPEEFIFYPAKTWPHKNHLRLLEGLAILRNQSGTVVPLVCSGQKTEFFRRISEEAQRLGVSDQAHFLGFVSPTEIQCLYNLSKCVVFPSLFEGCGMPILEAFFAGVAVASSNIGPIAEQADGAALLFDPHSAEQIADCIGRLWSYPKLRSMMAERGKRKIASRRWEKTARIFRSHYRRIGRRTLTDEDRALLTTPEPNVTAQNSGSYSEIIR